MRVINLLILLFLCSVGFGQTFTNTVTVQKDLRVQGETVLGGVSKLEDITLYADTIHIGGLDGTGTLLVIDGSGKVTKGTAGAGGVTGLAVGDVLFGDADGTIEQEGAFTYDESINTLYIQGGVSGGLSVTDGGTAFANVFGGSVAVTDGTDETIIASNKLTISKSTIYTDFSRASGGSSHTLTFPNAQGSANTYLKNDGSGNLAWDAFTGADVTGLTDNYALFGAAGGGIDQDIDFQFNGATLSIGGVDAMTVNGNAVTAGIQAHQSGGATNVEIEMHHHSNTAGGAASIYGARSRGGIGTESVVSSGDAILNITGVAYDGTDYATGAQIQFEVDGTPGSNDMPSRIVFSTAADGTQTLTERLRIDNAGLTTFNANIQFEGTADANETLLSITDPTADNTVTVQDITGTIPMAVGTPVSLTGQTASIAATTAYTAPVDGYYAVYYNATVTTAATTSCVLGPFQVKYTEAHDNVAKTFPTSSVNFVNQTNRNNTDAAIGGVFTVHAKAGTNIQYIMGYTSSGATAMQYNLEVLIIKIR